MTKRKSPVNPVRSTPGIWVKLDEKMKVVPATMHEAEALFKNQGRWHEVAELGGYRVSTVFLALDHGFGDRPLFFETCIFKGEHSDVVERYQTHAEAVAGQAHWVEQIKAGWQMTIYDDDDSDDDEPVDGAHYARGKKPEPRADTDDEPSTSLAEARGMFNRQKD